MLCYNSKYSFSFSGIYLLRKAIIAFNEYNWQPQAILLCSPLGKELPVYLQFYSSQNLQDFPQLLNQDHALSKQRALNQKAGLAWPA